MASTTPAEAVDISAPVHPNAHEDPKMSSAALCIQFSVTSFSFRPEFTHQLFPSGEWIRGYQPTRDVLLMQQQQEVPHSSHAHHNDQETSHELKISIQLAPSCRISSVQVQVQKKAAVATRASKRPRLLDVNSHEENVENEDEEKMACINNNADEDDSEFSQESSSSGDDSSPRESPAEGRTRGRRMPVAEILEALEKGLPKRLTNNKSVAKDYLTEPIGIVLHRYTSGKAGDQNFVVTVADGKQAAEYHAEVQRLALWFIETAQDVDITSDGGEGGYWKVVYLFHEQIPRQYALAGYITLFHFDSPFKKPKPGIVARVCQALILPPYQRSGHGKILLRTIHKEYVESESNRPRSKPIVEINVEDPAPGCVALRNRVDFERFQESLASETPWLGDKYTVSDPSSEGFFVGVSDVDAMQAGAIGGITPRQIQIAHELYKLSLLPADDTDEEMTKKYRLMVKKRLLRVHKEELGTVVTKEAKQAMLGELFDEAYSLYKRILGRK